MKTIQSTIQIQAPAEKVWQVLWNTSTNRQWARAFGEGMYYSSDWEEGGKVTLSNEEGTGGFGVIEKKIPNQLLRIREKGWIENWKALPIDYSVPVNGKNLKWEAGIGEYRLTENDGETELQVEIELGDDWAMILAPVFPAALKLIKEIAEGTAVLEVKTDVLIPIETAWKLFNDPAHIVNWNSASPDWHTPTASNDIRTGGKFSYRMEARDGSFGFDFNGEYTHVEAPEAMEYVMEDGRKASVQFSPVENGTRITTRFDAENSNSLDLQQYGWQAILDNFKKYAENL